MGDGNRRRFICVAAQLPELVEELRTASVEEVPIQWLNQLHFGRNTIVENLCGGCRPIRLVPSFRYIATDGNRRTRGIITKCLGPVLETIREFATHECVVTSSISSGDHPVQVLIEVGEQILSKPETAMDTIIYDHSIGNVV